MKAYDYVVVRKPVCTAPYFAPGSGGKKGKKVLVIEQTPKHRGKCIYGADGRDSCT